MTSTKLVIVTCLTALAFITSIGSFFIGFFEGPQIAHYINLTSLTLATVLIFALVISAFRKENEVFKRQPVLFVILILGISITLFVNITFINIRYGYSNWKYKNIFEMQFVDWSK